VPVIRQLGKYQHNRTLMIQRLIPIRFVQQSALRMHFTAAETDRTSWQ